MPLNKKKKKEVQDGNSPIYKECKSSLEGVAFTLNMKDQYVMTEKKIAFQVGVTKIRGEKYCICGTIM